MVLLKQPVAETLHMKYDTRRSSYGVAMLGRFLSALSFLLPLMWAQPCVAEEGRPISPNFDEVFESYSGEGKPGVSVIILQDDRVVFDREYGFANISDDIPITDDTAFNIGSISKQFTVFAILLLERDGLLSMDDDIRQFIPELIGVDEPITLEQLARHTAGIKSPNFLALMSGWRQADLRDHRQMLELVYRQRALEFVPGEDYKYSNAGTLLLAEVVSRISGKPFSRYMAEEVFEPLGMNATFVRDDVTSIIKSEAHGYFEEDGAVKTALNPISHFGFSNIYSTASDMGIWARNYWDPQLGGRDLIDKMLSPTVLADGRQVEHTMGMFLTPFRDVPQYQHTGSHRAYLGYLGVFPEDEAAIIMLSNDGRFDLFGYANSLASLMFPDAISPVPINSEWDVDDRYDYSQLKQHEGMYWDTFNKSLREIRVEQDYLSYIRPDGSSSRFNITTDGILIIDDPSIAFTLSFDGAQLVTEYNGDIDTFVKVDTDRNLGFQDFVGTYVSHELGQMIELFECDGSLKADVVKRPSFELKPVFEDTFETGQWFLSYLEFRRNGAGAISGFNASNVNVIDVWFSKVVGIDGEKLRIDAISACDQ